MKYAAIGSNRRFTLSVPLADGGINAAELPQNIQDNQCSDALNFWYKDGSVETRPATDIKANFVSNQDLKDVGIEVKFSVENKETGAQTQAHTYRILYCDHTFILLDLNTNTFTTLAVEFDTTNLPANAFTLGTVDELFLYSKGLDDEVVTSGGTEYQTFLTRTEGYFSIIGLTDSENVERIYRIFCYLTAYDDSGTVKIKLQCCNSLLNIPTNRLPYCPKVISAAGSASATTLEDFNLNSSLFQVDFQKIGNNALYSADGVVADSAEVNKGWYTGSPFNKDYSTGYKITVPVHAPCAVVEATFEGAFTFTKYELSDTTTHERSHYRTDITGKNPEFTLNKSEWVFLPYRPSTPVIGGGTTPASDACWMRQNLTSITNSAIKKTKTISKIVYHNGAETQLTYYDAENNEVDIASWLTDGYYPYSICGAPTITYESVTNTDYTTSTALVLTLPPASKQLTYKDFSVYTSQGEALTRNILTERWSNASMAQWTTAPAGSEPTGDNTQPLVDKTISFDGMAAPTINKINMVCLLSDSVLSTPPNYWTENDRSWLVTSNKLQTWYGGTNSGYTGGTRLFVAGHPNYKNVIRWSGVNDASYFLENNFCYIGRDDEAITALGKQDSYLIVFKEHELYALEYTYTTDESDNTLVYFPVTPISPNIGCDCPNTIQLVCNRLTWLSSSGKVYTLYSANQYSERNVREVSKHIEPLLKQHTKAELQAARSADYNGNYLLFVGDTVYLWNYDLNPLYNYTSSDKSQERLCWWKWKLPYAVDDVYEHDGVLCALCSSDTAHYLFALADNEADEAFDGREEPIKSKIKSKLFMFKEPYVYKKILKAFIEAKTKSSDMSVTFFTDEGDDVNPVFIHSNEKNNATEYSLRPGIKRTRAVGYTIENDKPIELITATIMAEAYGEVR